MYTLNADVYLTRRQRLHFVLDDAGDLAWSGKGIAAAFRFLHERNQNMFLLEGQAPDGKFNVKMSPCWTPAQRRA